MIYKQFQDIRLSALGLGAMRLPVLEGKHHRHAAVGGEAQVLDAAIGLLGGEVGIDAVLGVQVGVDVPRPRWSC